MELLEEFFAKIESGEVDRCGDFSSHFKARADVFAVLGGEGWEPAGLLMVVRGFGPGDLIAGVFGLVEEGKRDFLQPDALFFQDSYGFVENGLHIRGNNIEEELLGNTESEFWGFWGEFPGGVEYGLAFDAWQDGFE